MRQKCVSPGSLDEWLAPVFSRAEDEPGAIGDLNQVENPHAGYNQPTSTDPQFYRTVYNAVNIYLTEYLQHGLSEGVDPSGFTGDQLEYSSLIIEWVADHFFPEASKGSGSFIHTLGCCL